MMILSEATPDRQQRIGTNAKGGPMPNFPSFHLLLVLGSALCTTAGGQVAGRFSDLPSAAQSRVSEVVARESNLSETWVRARLSGSDLHSGNGFGSSLSISGDTVVVASRAFGCVEGGAYVFVKPATGWQDITQTAKLTGSDWGGCGVSGFDLVAISGDTIIAGPGPSGASTYVFVKPKGGWKDMTETAQLSPTANLYIMQSLAISGNTVAVGYPNAIGNEVGAAAVFVEPAGGWEDMTQQTATLTASDPNPGEQLGWAVTIDGNTVMAGAPYANVNGIQSAGAVYVFVRPGTEWADMTQTAKLTPTYNIGGELGQCLSLRSGVAVACSSTTAAFIFVEPVTGWSDMTPTAALDNPPNTGGFVSASVSGNVIAVGAPETPGYPLYYGATLAFRKPSNGWQDVSSPNAAFWGKPSGGSQAIGYSVAVDGSALVTGAPYFGNAKGIVYLFAPK
jgi:hypothetical protein